MEDIKDTEIRILGDAGGEQSSTQASSESAPVQSQKRHRQRMLWWMIVGVLVLLSVTTLVVVHCVRTSDKEGEAVFEKAARVLPPHPLREWIAECDAMEHDSTTTYRGTLFYNITVNDIPMRFMCPINAKPRLAVGYKCLQDTANTVLLWQAADIRADNQNIVGAFVLHGKPLSWGLSKRGYCAIIDDSVTIGVLDNSPLFEEATERNGDFFRQYPLVDNGVLVENELKTKCVRRALCELEGRVVVAETGTTESLHDFAQALVDVGVDNAIYLVGSSAIGWWMDTDGVGTPSGNWESLVYKNISFIIWK